MEEEKERRGEGRGGEERGEKEDCDVDFVIGIQKGLEALVLEEGEDGESNCTSSSPLISPLPLSPSLSPSPPFPLSLCPSRCLLDPFIHFSQFIGEYHIFARVHRREVTCSRRHSHSFLHYLQLKGYVTSWRGEVGAGEGVREVREEGKRREGGGKEEEEKNK